MITLRVEANWEQGTTATHVRAGTHQVVIDEPAAVGGGDLGPNPMQYLFSAMAGCLIGMGRMVAKEKGLDIRHIRCRVEGDLDPVGMTGQDPAVRPGCREIRMAVSAESPEPADRIADWLATVEKRCPVRDNVANATVVITGLKA